MVTTIGSPLTWVKGIHSKNDMKKSSQLYDQIFIKIIDATKMSSFTKKIKKMNLQITHEVKTYNKLYDWLNKINYVLWGIASFLLFISFISLFNSFSSMVIEKKYELGLYLVFGSSGAFLIFLITIHGFLWGVIHSLGSIYLAEFILNIIKTNVHLIPFTLDLGLNNIYFDITSKEKIILFIGISLLSSFASFLPALLSIYKKNISLVQK